MATGQSSSPHECDSSLRSACLNGMTLQWRLTARPISPSSGRPCVAAAPSPSLDRVSLAKLDYLVAWRAVKRQDERQEDERQENDALDSSPRHSGAGKTAATMVEHKIRRCMPTQSTVPVCNANRRR